MCVHVIMRVYVVKNSNKDATSSALPPGPQAARVAGSRAVLCGRESPGVAAPPKVISVAPARWRGVAAEAMISFLGPLRTCV